MNFEKLCGFGNMEFRQFLIRLIMTFLGHYYDPYGIKRN